MASIVDSLMSLVGKSGVDPKVMNSVNDLLGDGSSIGGLSGLLDKAKAAGLDKQVSSWIGMGKNEKVSPDQAKELLGSDQINQIAGKLGINPDQVAKQISAALPKLVDQMTPDGKIPSPA
jgi:uncharacterized protein YidB (DUF937 family)